MSEIKTNFDPAIGVVSLTLLENDCVYVGKDIQVKIKKIGAKRVGLVIQAPRSVEIIRSKLMEKIQKRERGTNENN